MTLPDHQGQRAEVSLSSHVANAVRELNGVAESCYADLKLQPQSTDQRKIRESSALRPVSLSGADYPAVLLRSTTVGIRVYWELVARETEADRTLASWDHRGIGLGESGLTTDPTAIQSIQDAVNSLHAQILAEQQKARQEAIEKKYGPPRGPKLNDGFY